MIMSKYKLFQWCPIQLKVVPIEEVQRRVQSNARDLFIQDEMEPTRNPLNPKEIYTSKAKLREAYKAAGAVEIGDAYDRGYDPQKGSERRQSELVKRVMSQVRDRING
jgi:hypothetical protein